jgi:Tol biopolymer transport system component
MRTGVRGWLVIAVMVIVAAAGALLPALWKKKRTPAGGLPAPSPLTVFPGSEDEPGFSPDDQELVFTWQGDLYRLRVGSRGPRRLTSTPEPEADPAWSRDGQSIAFWRRDAGDASTLCLMPSAGGYFRRLVSLDAGRGLAWTPDGKWLIASRREGASSPYALVLINPENGAVINLSTPPPASFGDQWPAISPTGNTIAAVRATAPGSGGIILLRTEHDPPEAIQTHMATRAADWDIAAPAWTPDSRDLLFAATNKDGPALWRLALGTSRTPARLSELGPARGRVTLSRSGAQLVFSREMGPGERDLMLVEGFR